MSLRKAINAKCRDCTYDPLDVGTAAQQIACCVETQCPLHAVRPITATVIPLRLLDCYSITLAQLDTKARELVRVSPMAPESGQIDHILITEAISGSGA